MPRRSAGRILVTPRSLTVAGLTATELNPLISAGFELVSGPPGRTPDETELMDLVGPCVGWLAGVEPINARVIERAADLRVISRNGVGVDNIDLEAARRHGINVLRAPGSNARAVAELAIGLILAAIRRIPSSDRAIRAGRWQRVEGRELSACTVGVAGLGGIGGVVAQLVGALGAAVVAYDPMVPDGRRSYERAATLDDLLRNVDVLTLHVPGQPGNAPLLREREFRIMRRGTVVVNTARASLVDSTALLHALDDGLVGCYAVDVFDQEPPAFSWLYRHENVISTPHIGGFTTESVARATGQAVANLLDVLMPTTSSR